MCLLTGNTSEKSPGPEGRAIRKARHSVELLTEKEGSIEGPSPPKKPKREGEEEGGLDNESEKEFGEDSLFLDSFCFDENVDGNSTGLLTKHSCL